MLVNKYNIKNLNKVKIIIRWQMIREIVINIMKINQLVFIKNVIIKKKLINCNANIISIKV